MTSKYIVRTDNTILDTHNKQVVIVLNKIYIKDKESGEWRDDGEVKLQFTTIKDMIRYHNEMVEKKKEGK